MAKILIMARVSYATLITRLNIILRWMVRNDGRKVDFDIRNKVDPLMLNIPIHLHQEETPGNPDY